MQLYVYICAIKLKQIIPYEKSLSYFQAYVCICRLLLDNYVVINCIDKDIDYSWPVNGCITPF